ncbi:iron-containing alcohol dehydrogenase [Agrococcus sp. ARC_14]|uniref:iron-containing alcohol dehydrogenase n=1 Tax=Agrococcus sp. ARC_14 TaxID=2919927 RepID=UPI00240844B6|nr:iron-containing alcohol dehydrogenase [Agrococcus sp. ARC_14]
MSTHFSSPPRLLMGDDALESAAADLSALGSRVLIVTDPGIVAAGILELVLDPLRMSGLPVATFTDVVGNPDVATVAAAFAALQADGADIVVAVGGGSSMDVAKSIALLATNGGEIGDYEGVDRFQHRPLPIIMIPTTVGSGSEVTKGAVITNHETNVKMVIVSDLLFATIAILDPRVVAKLPGRIAATTGMDALTHAIEAYVAKGANPVTDAINIGAIELIGASLVKASRGDAAALYDMLVASSMAGIGFHDAGLGAVHALANTLGAHYGVHHGTANALFLPYVMDYNISAAPARFARIARALGENTAGLSDAEAASLAAKAVHRLADETGVPRTLSELEIADDRLEDLARDALQQADLPGNPREATYDDLLALYRRAA